MIHINELLLQHLIIQIDGKYSPDQGWTRPLEKLLSKVHDLEINGDFTIFPIIELPDKIVKNLSTNQKNCYWSLSAMKPVQAVYPNNWLTSNLKAETYYPDSLTP